MAHELRLLQTNYEAMVSTLASFSKYVAPIVVKNLVTTRTEARLVSCHNSDLFKFINTNLYRNW
jgi:hypothetical protein